VLIDRDHGQLALLPDRQTAQVIHDRLPFLDLAGYAMSRANGNEVAA